MRRMSMYATIAVGMMSAAAFGQSRAFMDGAGNAGAGQPTTGNTAISMDPGTSREIEAWVVDADAGGPKMASYQLIFQCAGQAQGGATGSVDYLDNNPGMGGGDSVVIDTARGDWVFAGSLAITPPVYNETCNTNIFGVIYNTAIPVDDKDINATFGDAPTYMASFTIEASGDACGDHLYVWNIAENGGVPPLAALFAPGGTQWEGGDQPTEFQNLLISIGPDNDACSDATDLSGPQVVSQAFDTTCATVDGPQDCAAGADIWFSYTTAGACLGGFEYSVTNGDVAVYENGACVPGPGGECNGAPIVNAGGETYLIQVIGDGIQGNLDLRCAGCASNAECDDDNPCTTDTCNPDMTCSNTPNNNPCDDGDPCTLSDTCSGGSCQPGPVDDCNDFNPCTDDSCIAGTGCENTDINGATCAVDADCNTGTVEGASCDDGSCACTSGMVNALCLELRNPKEDDDTPQCPVDGADSNCPDGTHCIDGACVSQACYAPGSEVVVDLELFPTPEDTICGGQFFLNYATECLTLTNLETDPDGELGWSFVMVNQVSGGDIDLALGIAPAQQCCVDAGNPLCGGTRTGGTIARLTFQTTEGAEGDCKCDGVNFRVHNPPTGASGPKGAVDLGGCNDEANPSDTDAMRIQPDTFIVGGPAEDDIDTAADCGTFTKTITYPPFTVEDPCAEGTATPDCTVMFNPACFDSLDCGMGDLCNSDDDCGNGPCMANEAAQEIGFTGFCALGTCVDGVCDNAAVPPGVNLDDYLDCSDGCDFLPGETTIWCEYTNSCGNTEERHITIDNSGLNKLLVDVELSPSMVDGSAADPITRCIDFSLSACDAATFFACSSSSPTPGDLCFPQDMNACGGFPEMCVETPADSVDVSVNVVFGAPENIPGHGTACIEVPPANYDCLEATDPKHSLTSTCTVECNEDGMLYAQFKGSKASHPSCHWLVQGNLDGNPNIDIFDYTIVAGEYLNNYMSNDTLCKDPNNPPEGNNFNADFNGDKLVTLADWSFVVFNFFCASKDPCSVICDPAPQVGSPAAKRDKPRGQVTVRELFAIGLGDYAEAADVNNDGVVNLTDISLFFENVDDNDGDVESLKKHVKQLERSHRERDLPRAKRTR